jgi:WD40 repeat protein
LHELQHIKRRDALTALFAELVRAVFFFHPLVHWLVGRLRLEREQICDNAALASACDPRHYARVLMQFAANPGPSLVGVLQTALALPLGRRRTIKIRVQRLLSVDPSLFTSPLSWRRHFGIVAIVALMIGLAGNVRILDTAQAEPALLETAKKKDQGTATEESGKSVGKYETVAGRAKPAPPANEEVRPANTDLYGDSLPRGALARLGTVRYRHEGWHKRIEFLANSHTFVVGTYQNTAKLWEASNGKLVRESKIDGLFASFAVSRDGKEFATLGANFDPQRRESDMWLQVIDNDTGRLRMEAKWIDQSSDFVPMAFAPDGKSIALGTRMGKLRLWDLATANELPNEVSLKGGIESIDFSPDGKLIAMAGHSAVAVWRWLAEKEPKLLDGLDRGGQVVKFSPNGALLAVGSYDHAAARLWSVESQRWHRELKGATERYYRVGLCFSRDGSQLIVPSGPEPEIEFFDVRSGALVRTLDASAIEPSGVAVSSDSKFLATVGSRAEIEVWDLESGERISDRYVGHAEAPNELAFTPDGKHVVSSGLGSTIRVWDSNTGRQLRLMKHDNWVSGIALAPNGKLLVSCGLDNTVRLWNLETGEQIFKVIGHGRLGGNPLTEVAFTGDGQRFISFGRDMFLRVWDVSTGKALTEHAIRPSEGEVKEAADRTVELTGDDPFGESGGQNSFVPLEARFAKSDQLLLSTRNGIHVFDVASGREVERRPSETLLSDFALSSDSRWLATTWRQQSGGSGKKDAIDAMAQMYAERKSVLHLSEYANQKASRDINVPGILSPITFSSTGRFVACRFAGRSPDATYEKYQKYQQGISVWEVETGREYARIEGLGKHSHKLAFSPDEKRLAVSQWDSTVLIWDLEQFRLLQPAE